MRKIPITFRLNLFQQKKKVLKLNDKDIRSFCFYFNIPFFTHIHTDCASYFLCVKSIRVCRVNIILMSVAVYLNIT